MSLLGGMVMENFRQFTIVAVLALAHVVPMHGQDKKINEGYQSGRLIINFNSDTLKYPTEECKQAEMLVAFISSKMPLPNGNWRFVVVCDEETWKNLMTANKKQLIRNDRDPTKGEIYSNTILEKNITIFRGFKLVHPDKDVMPEHIIAHELAHIYLHSPDERKVEKLALQWVSEYKTNSVISTPATQDNVIASR
jgi:hypothetical protein